MFLFEESLIDAYCQGCGVGGFWEGGVGVLRMLEVGVRVGFLRGLGVGVGFFCPTPTLETQLFFF